jgi:thiamine biosynthesis lipoprotein ApbE
VQDRRAAWSAAPDATTADALSTAFMIMDLDEIERYCSVHSDALALIILQEDSPRRKDTILHFGRWDRNVLVE